MQQTLIFTHGSGYSFASISLASGGIFTDAGLSSAISGATLTQWNSATLVQSHQ